MQNKRVFGMMTAAGCALFAASAMGAVSDTFEGQAAGDAVTTIAGWEGYGTVTAATYTGAGDGTVGRPIVQASANPARVLAVEGCVTRTATTTANNAATVDMMVQIALPDDDLAFPSGTTTTDIQIAVGVDKVAGSETTGALKAWCKPRAGGDPAWVDLGVTYEKDSWHRVSFTFDYANQLCQIRVDGEPVGSANGVLAAGSELTARGTSWPPPTRRRSRRFRSSAPRRSTTFSFPRRRRLTPRFRCWRMRAARRLAFRTRGSRSRASRAPLRQAMPPTLPA